MINYTAFKEDIIPKCDQILIALKEKHPLITWRYWLNHVDFRNEQSPIESVDFKATILVNGIDRHIQQRITVEMIELSNIPIDEMISYRVADSLVKFIMGDVE